MEVEIKRKRVLLSLTTSFLLTLPFLFHLFLFFVSGVSLLFFLPIFWFPSLSHYFIFTQTLFSPLFWFLFYSFYPINHFFSFPIISSPSSPPSVHQVICEKIFRPWFSPTLLGAKAGLPLQVSFFPCALSLKLFLMMIKMMLNEWMWSWGWHLGGAAASSAGVLRNRQRWGGQRRWRPTRRKTWKQQRHLPASPQHPDSPSARERGVSGRRWRMGWERSCPQRTELLMKK